MKILLTILMGFALCAALSMLFVRLGCAEEITVPTVEDGVYQNIIPNSRLDHEIQSRFGDEQVVSHTDGTVTEVSFKFIEDDTNG